MFVIVASAVITPDGFVAENAEEKYFPVVGCADTVKEYGAPATRTTVAPFTGPQSV